MHEAFPSGNHNVKKTFGSRDGACEMDVTVNALGAETAVHSCNSHATAMLFSEGQTSGSASSMRYSSPVSRMYSTPVNGATQNNSTMTRRVAVYGRFAYVYLKHSTVTKAPTRDVVARRRQRHSFGPHRNDKRSPGQFHERTYALPSRC